MTRRRNHKRLPLGAKPYAWNCAGCEARVPPGVRHDCPLAPTAEDLKRWHLEQEALKAANGTQESQEGTTAVRGPIAIIGGRYVYAGKVITWGWYAEGPLRRFYTANALHGPIPIRGPRYVFKDGALGKGKVLTWRRTPGVVGIGYFPGQTRDNREELARIAEEELLYQKRQRPRILEWEKSPGFPERQRRWLLMYPILTTVPTDVIGEDVLAAFLMGDAARRGNPKWRAVVTDIYPEAAELVPRLERARGAVLKDSDLAGKPEVVAFRRGLKGVRKRLQTKAAQEAGKRSPERFARAARTFKDLYMRDDVWKELITRVEQRMRHAYDASGRRDRG